MMDVTPLRAVLTVVAALLTGGLSAAFGVGGAVVSTPAIRLLGVSAAFAVGTTLPAILPSAVAGTVRYGREGLVRWAAVAWVAPPGVLAAVGGSALSGVVPGEGHLLMLLTAGLLGFTAWRMARTADPPEVDVAPALVPSGPRGGAAGPEEAEDASVPVRPAVLVALGGSAGALAGLLGVGGGIVLVPGLSAVARLDLKVAIATSLACVGLLAVPATLTHWSLGDIDWATAGWLSLGVVPGARLGAAAAIRASDRGLRRAVAGFLGAVAVVYAAVEAAALLSR